MASKQTYVANMSERVTRFLDDWALLRETVQQYHALDYTNQLGDGETFNISGDAPITKADVLAVISTLEAIQALLTSGHFTNLYKMRR